MSQRRPDPTKWVWCMLVLSSGSTWSPVSSVTVRSPEKIPSTIEAQAKFFQDFFSVQLSPYKIEFGHVCEDPNTWEQRYEKKDFKNHRDMGKVRWGDTKGGYGEHYWDLNHSGHVGKQEEQEDEYYDDDYNEELQDYPETGEKTDHDREEYYPDASEYEKSSRPKRENTKMETQALKSQMKYPEMGRPIQKISYNEPTQRTKRDLNFQNDYELKMKLSLNDKRQRHLHEYNKENFQPADSDHIVLVVNHKINKDEDSLTAELKHVPYKVADLRRLKRQVAPASMLGLFLESSTGRVIV